MHFDEDDTAQALRERRARAPDETRTRRRARQGATEGTAAVQPAASSRRDALVARPWGAGRCGSHPIAPLSSDCWAALAAIPDTHLRSGHRGQSRAPALAVSRTARPSLFSANIAGQVACAVTGARRGAPSGRFWDYTAWSRVVAWGRDYAKCTAPTSASTSSMASGSGAVATRPIPTRERTRAAATRHLVASLGARQPRAGEVQRGAGVRGGPSG